MNRLKFLIVLFFQLSAVATGWTQANGKLQIHFIDVGQGDGALLISPLGETVLFDDGAVKYCDKPVAYLQQLGVKQIDYHITSHYHSDHIGCCGQVLREFPLQKDALDRGGSYNSAVFRAYLEAVGTHRKTATAGSTLTLDADSTHPVKIEIVAVNGNGIQTDNENDLSLDAVVRFGNFNAEIGGDLSGYDTSTYKDIESSVAAKVGQLEVYKVHHHGSSHSSNPNWLKATTPKVAIISCGNGNTYNHPTQECLDQLHRFGARTYWTETGNGVPPEPGQDIVGGNIVVEVAPSSSTFTVTYGQNRTDKYTTWKAGTDVPLENPSTPTSPIALYAWSKNSEIYHYIHCKYVDSISLNNLETGSNPPQGKRRHESCPR